MPDPSPSPLRAELAKSGFVIQRSILSAAELESLRAAAARTTALARSGSWPDVRTVGKQFPPWTFDPKSPGGGIWGVQGLLHPSLPDAPVFARSYFGDAVLGVAKELLGCGDDELVMELFNMLVRPERDFALRWHRDDVPADADEAEERRRLGLDENDEGEGEGGEKKRYWHTQWNLALYPDSSLVVVPGSHARARTPAERAADPFAPRLPGQLVVELGAGDVVFYDNNILHRGVYDAARERMSLHGSVGRAAGGRLRARNVLQHGVGAWVDRCDFAALGERGSGDGSRLRERAEGMRDRLVSLGRESGEVGYSLTG
ncbi:phytanoyl-CoA dioxygenase family protein [Biscogniauxia marginata]|nr:phytanoyl-CoA dioxygenase family protein [Biscogniauxia marginata]